MFFVFTEDGCLEIVDTIKEIRTNYEGIDVESGVYEFFDQKGSRLKPRFSKPNKVKKYFGLISTVESGQFDLIADVDPGSDSIFTLLKETSHLKSNKHFKSLANVKMYLEAGNESKKD